MTTTTYAHLTILVQRTTPDQVGLGWGKESDESVAKRATAAEVAAVQAEYPGADVDVWDHVAPDERVRGAGTDEQEIADRLAEIREESWQSLCHDEPAAPATGSSGITAWAGGMAIEDEWTTGSGDARLTGWVRADGARAIETNGDPVFDGDDGFVDAWAAGSGS